MNLQTGHAFFHSRWVIGLAMAVALLVPAARSSAQSSTTPTGQLGAEAAPAGQIQTAPQPQPAPAPRSGAPYWASIGGYEADSHDTGYGFFGPQYVRPFSDNMSFVGSANANYLYYDYATADGHTNVRSPGITTMGGVQFGTRNWFLLQAGPSFKRRHVETVDAADRIIASEKGWDVGFNLGASLWVDPTTHNNIFAMYNYDAVDNYNWGRLAFKEQVANRSWSGAWTPYLGVEYIGQGNEDIRSNQFGGFVEILHAPSSVSVMLRGGYKRSTFEFGPARTGPWFAVGFFHRLR